MPEDAPARTSSACDSCPSRCCTGRFGYQSINLTYDERQDPLFALHLDAYGNFKLENRNCRFLDTVTHRCTIYERRPAACRGFVCHDAENQGRNTLAMIYRDRGLRAHLESLGLLPPLEEDLYWAENSRRVPTTSTTSSNMHRPESFDAGTWRFFKLEAATGRIVLEGRRRSTSRYGEPASAIRQLLNEKEQAKWRVAEDKLLEAVPACAELPDYPELKTETIHDIEITAEAC